MNTIKFHLKLAWEIFALCILWFTLGTWVYKAWTNTWTKREWWIVFLFAAISLIDVIVKRTRKLRDHRAEELKQAEERPKVWVP